MKAWKYEKEEENQLAACCDMKKTFLGSVETEHSAMALNFNFLLVELLHNKQYDT